MALSCELSIMIVVKVYNKTLSTLKETIEWDIILSDVAFSANVNWWQWELSLQLKKPITSTDYNVGDIIKIKKYSEENKSWYDLYMWYVWSIGRVQTITSEYIELRCLWIASLCTENNTSLNYNNLPAWQLIRNILQTINTSQWWNVISFNTTTIPDWPLMWSWSISETDCASAITTIAQAIGQRWYIDWSGTAYLFDKPTTPTHFLTNKVDVENITINETIQDMVNSVYFRSQYNPSQNTSYTDTASVALYGQKYARWPVPISWQTALDNYAIQFVNDNKDPRKESRIIVNIKYPLEILNPWDTVKVKNFEYSFDNIQIEKVQYSQDRCTLYLDKYNSFGKQIKSLANP